MQPSATAWYDVHPAHSSRRGFRRLVKRMARPLRREELAAPAVVFAPHPDDETLGCGGVIVKKLQAGAPLAVVFMTDGSGSHSRLMARDKLGRLRQGEALAAAGVLGLDAKDVFFLDYPDQSLAEHAGDAVRRCCDILRQRGAAQAFAPFPNALHSDHLATNRIARQALGELSGTITLLEYPIWFWNQWPWVAMRPPGRRHIPRLLWQGAVSAARAAWCFRRSVDVSGVLDRKRRALEQYRSQMTRLMDDPQWHTLQEVSEGQLLEALLDGREVFHQVRFG